MEHQDSNKELVFRRKLPPGIAYPSPQGTLSHADFVAGDLGTESKSGSVLEYWQMMRRHWKAIAVFALFGILAALLITLPQTPVYQAQTALEIQNVNGDFLNTKQVSPVSEDSDLNFLADVQTQMKIIGSEGLVDRAIDKFKSTGALEPLYSSFRRPSLFRTILRLPAPSPADIDYNVRQTIRKNIGVQEVGQTRIVEISFKSTDPRFSAQFVNALASEYIDSSMEARGQMSERTSRWLSGQLGEMRKRLRHSEDVLQAYASRSGLLFIAPLSGNADQNDVSDEKLREIQQALTATQAELAAAQSRYEITQSAPPDSLGEVLNDKPLRELQAKLTDLRRQKAELSVIYKPNHEKVRSIEAQIAPLQAEFDKERNAITEHIQVDYDTALRHETLLRQTYAAQTRVVTNQAEKAIQYSILKRDVDSNRQLYESTLQQIKEADVASAIRASNVRIIDPAQIPRKPSSPRLKMNCAGGLLGGLMFGVIFAVIRERADRTLQAPGDAKLWTNLPELGTIPTGKLGIARGMESEEETFSSLQPERRAWNLLAKTRKGKDPFGMIGAPKAGVISDAFQSLLTSLLFSAETGSRPKAVVLTSASRMEGKTTVTSNLGIVMAQSCNTVLIIDGDLRRPRMHEIFGLSNNVGLSTLLTSEKFDAERAIEFTDKTSIPGLDVLTSGPSVSPAKTNLLYSPRLPQILAKLRKTYDMILIDTPPMLHMTDARLLGKLADGVIVVVRARKTTRDAAQIIKERLAEDGTRVLGTILNDWNPRQVTRGGYGYYDKMYYGPEKDEEEAERSYVAQAEL